MIIPFNKIKTRQFTQFGSKILVFIIFVPHSSQQTKINETTIYKIGI